MADSKKSRRGQCQCGYIQYRLNGDPLTFYLCHCLDCQKQSSSAFGMSLWVNRGEIEFVSGELQIWTTQGDSGLAKICAFCRRCGSRIYHASDDDHTPISLKAGTLIGIASLTPIAHVWVKRAQPWLTIDRNQIRCYEEAPDSDENLLRLWQASHQHE